eukprot:350855-Chlamydomonas_euryale.AAC.3
MPRSQRMPACRQRVVVAVWRLVALGRVKGGRRSSDALKPPTLPPRVEGWQSLPSFQPGKAQGWKDLRLVCSQASVHTGANPGPECCILGPNLPGRTRTHTGTQPGSEC